MRGCVMSAVSRDDAMASVKRMVLLESRLPAHTPVADDEQLAGPLLAVNSMGFVGVLIRLEDELDVTLANDLFVGRTFHTVADIVDVLVACA
jgi:acyl carrier protein